MATCFAMANLGVLLGPPLAGFLATHLGAEAPYLFGAGLVAVDFLLRWAWLEEVPPRAATKLPMGLLLKDRAVVAFAGALGLGAGLWGLLEATLPLHLDAVHRLGPRGIGLCFTAAAVAHTLTSPLMGRLSDRIGRRRVVIAGCLCALVVVPLPVLAPTVPAVVASLMAFGAVASLLMSPSSPGVADAVERLGGSDFGAGFSILNITYAAGMMVGPYLGSALAQAFGLKAALLAAGAVIGAYAFVMRRVVEVRAAAAVADSA
jgi:MFS family permease